MNTPLPLFSHVGAATDVGRHGFDKLRYHVDVWHGGREEASDMMHASGAVRQRGERKPVKYHADFTIKLNRVKNVPTTQRDPTIDFAYKKLIEAKEAGMFGKCIVGEPKSEGSDYILNLRVVRSIYSDKKGQPKQEQLDNFDQSVVDAEDALTQLLHGIKRSESHLPDVEYLALADRNSLTESGASRSGRCGVKLVDVDGDDYYAACFEFNVENADAITSRLEAYRNPHLTNNQVGVEGFRVKRELIQAGKTWLQEHLPKDQNIKISVTTQPLRLAVWQVCDSEKAAENTFAELKTKIEGELREFNCNYALQQHENKHAARNH